MVPVDEYLPIMYDRHPNSTWKLFFNNRNLKEYSCFPADHTVLEDQKCCHDLCNRVVCPNYGHPARSFTKYNFLRM